MSPAHQKAGGTNAQCFNFFTSATERAVGHSRNPYLKDTQQVMAVTILLQQEQPTVTHLSQEGKSWQ